MNRIPDGPVPGQGLRINAVKSSSPGLPQFFSRVLPSRGALRVGPQSSSSRPLQTVCSYPIYTEMFQLTPKHLTGCDPVMTRFTRVHVSGKAQMPAPKATSAKPLPFLVPGKTAPATYSIHVTSILHPLAPSHAPCLSSLYFSIFLGDRRKKRRRRCKGASADKIPAK